MRKRKADSDALRVSAPRPFAAYKDAGIDEVRRQELPTRLNIRRLSARDFFRQINIV